MDPIAHTLTEKPLARAVTASVDALVTLLSPLATPPAGTLGKPVRAAPLAGAAEAAGGPAGGEGGMLRLPPPCARFSLLPVQTPQLRHQAAGQAADSALGGGGASNRDDEYDDARAEGGEGGAGAAVTAVFARVGDVLSSVKSGGLGGSVLGSGLGGSVLSGRLDTLSRQLRGSSAES